MGSNSRRRGAKSSRVARPTDYWHGGSPGLNPGDRLIGAAPPVLAALYAVSDIPHDASRVYVTTDKQLARVFAAIHATVPGQVGGTLYNVRPQGVLQPDPDYPFDPPVSFACSGATVVHVAERRVRMSEGAQARAEAPYLRWADGQPMYDEDGYMTLSPEAAEGGLITTDMLRDLGPWRTYGQASDEIQRRLWGMALPPAASPQGGTAK